MRPPRKIEDVVKEMSFAAGPEMDRRLRRGIAETSNKMQTTACKRGDTSIWSILMNSRMTQLAVVALVGSIVLIALYCLGIPVDGTTTAMAQVKKAISNVPWMHVIVDVNAPDNAGRSEEWICFPRSIEITKRPDGTVRYRDESQDTLSVYDPTRKTVTITSLSDRYAHPRKTPLPTSAGATLTAMLDSTQSEDKATVIVVTDDDKKSIEVIKIERPVDDEEVTKQSITIVVDPESNLPVTMETVFVRAPDTALGQACATFDYPQDGPATIYDVNVPVDAKVIDRRPKPETADEAEIHYDVTTDSDDPAQEALMLYGGVNIDLVKVPAGEFLMGCPDTEVGYAAPFLERFGERLKEKYGSLHPPHEGPQHRGKIERGFYISKFEITCGQFRRFRPEFRKLPHFVGPLGGKMTRCTTDADDQPACVPRPDAESFCQWINDKTGLKVRLPSEAEWEYACRAGTQTRFYWGDSEEDIGQYANVVDQAYERACPRMQYTLNADDGYVGPAPVGQFRPNAFGLYDMIGNAPEWTQGIYGDNARSIDPDGKLFDPNDEDNQYLYCRGGSWQTGLTYCRSASRWMVESPGTAGSDSGIGFRILIEQ